MIIQISGILDEARAAAAREALSLSGGGFVDGGRTAGWQAKAVKNNEQGEGPASLALMESVKESLLKHPVFKAAAWPKAFVKVLVSRYRPGMAYGTHVDDPLMGGVRTDLSFTLFLSPPESYEGGELVIEGTDGDTPIKLPAGSLVLYPTGALHRVAEVTRGERLAVVGWVRSLIRLDAHREALFDIENIIAALRASGASRDLIDRQLKLRANLLRMWADD